MFKAKTHPLLDIYAMLWHTVRAFPPVTDGAGLEMSNKRPQTFAALTDINDIEVDTLKKDARYADQDKHLFYSRLWSDQYSNRQQTGSLQFKYPLVAIQPASTSPQVKDPYTNVRISLAVLDQHPDKLNVSSRGNAYASTRTFEELEADLNNILENTIREWLGRWAAYIDSAGTITWSPVPLAGEKVLWKMRDAILSDGSECLFYADIGVDRVAAVQTVLTLKMRNLSCYLPSGQGGAVSFDYTQGAPSPRMPDQTPDR
jgi:hypothetical protein